MRLLRHVRLSPATVIACIALAIALGGTSYAAVTALPRNSVTSVQVKDYSLLRRDFKRGQVPAGPAGAAGAAGPVGPAGPAGPTGPAGPAGSANVRWALVKADGTIAAQSGNIAVASHSTGEYIVDFNQQLNTKLILASPAQAGNDTGTRGSVSAGPCGGTAEGTACSVRNDTLHVRVLTYQSNTTLADHAFYVAVIG